MSANIINSGNLEPFYYHREYSNDFPKPKKEAAQKTWVDDAQRFGLVALPFISLYKPLSLPLSLAMGGLRVLSCSSQLLASIQQGEKKDIAYQAVQTAIAVIALAGTIIAHPAGMLITTTHDILLELYNLLNNLKQGQYEAAALNCVNIVNNTLYFALFVHGGLEIAAASLAVQVIIGAYHARAEFKQGHHLEAAGHILMALIRGNQLRQKLETVHFTAKLKALATTGAVASLTSVMMIDKTNPDTAELVDILVKYGNNPEGVPALHYAVIKQDERAVQLLLQNGASPNASAYHMTYDFFNLPSATNPVTPLDFAAKSGNVTIIKHLLESGAQVNFKTTHEHQVYSFSPPLCIAAKYDNPEAMRLLISCGANYHPLTTPMKSNSPYYHISPAHVAVENGSIKALNVLAEFGVDFKVSYFNQSLLHVAAQNDQPESIRFLIKHGLYVDEKADNGQTPLHYATWGPTKLKATKELLKHKANCNLTDSYGYRPIDNAIQNYSNEDKASVRNRFDALKLHIDNGLDLEFKTRETTVLWKTLVCYARADEDVKLEYKNMMDYLNQKGANINAKDSNGKTFLAQLKYINVTSDGRRKEITDWLKLHGATE